MKGKVVRGGEGFLVGGERNMEEMLVRVKRESGKMKK